ncbi:hypothetical protein C9374_006035 [Naegleria lovaniensis]|uniref:Uncharacterized protein n=1 Tax=Naegleria lovaniensis TaxID=51637 RepID=A0AA88KMN3_NAELO|nr:uncharacterized protein C9374_006035 [Naegleria lovaniensis]KAG2381651.1 hypothetical protein C9374_006035 [Naegleria lovaniensis]
MICHQQLLASMMTPKPRVLPSSTPLLVILLTTFLFVTSLLCHHSVAIPSYYTTKSTTDGELVQINLLEREIEGFFSTLNQHPSYKFDTLLDEYFPDLKYISPNTTKIDGDSAASTTTTKILVNNLHVHIPHIGYSGPDIPKNLPQLKIATFVGNVRDLRNLFEKDWKKNFKSVQVVFSKSDIIYIPDEAERNMDLIQSLTSKSPEKHATIFESMNLEPGVERFFVAFRRKYLIVHKNHLRMSSDGVTLMLWEKNTQPNSKKRPYLVRMWHEVYDRDYFVYLNYGERFPTPYEHEPESQSKFYHVLTRFFNNHEDERGNPRLGVTEDMKSGHTPERVLARLFPLTAEENSKLHEMNKVVSHNVEFAFPISTHPVFGLEAARKFYSALISKNNVERVFMYLTSPIFSYNNDFAGASVTYLIYPSKTMNAENIVPVTCNAIIHFSINHLNKLTRFHSYFDLNACINKLATGSATSKWVTVEL